TFSNLDTSNVFSGSAHVDLPIYIGSLSSPISIGNPNDLKLDIADLKQFISDLAHNRSLSTDLKVVLPNLDLFKNPPSIFQLLAAPSVVVDGLDNVLKALQDALSGEILGVQIPFIGDALANNPVTHFIENIREQILAPLANTLRANNVGLQGLIN